MINCNLTKSDLATILHCLEYALQQVETSGGEIQVIPIDDQQKYLTPILDSLRDVFNESVTKQEDATVLFTTEPQEETCKFCGSRKAVGYLCPDCGRTI